MSLSAYKQLCEQIKQLPCFKCFSAEFIKIQRIEAGQSSLCFDVTLEGSLRSNEKAHAREVHKYFVKYDNNASFFENELEASKAASRVGLSPKVVYANKHWLVNEFIEAETLDNTIPDIKSRINVALNLMVRCHKLHAPVPTLNIKKITSQLIASDNVSSSQKQFLNALLNNLPVIDEIPHDKHVLCHGDINFSNIMTVNNKAWLIDFECTCLADKEFDIAMFFAINQLDTEQQIYTLNCYEQINNTGHLIDKSKLHGYLLYSYLINGLWYFDKVINTAESKNTHFYQLAFKQFNLFDKLFPTDSPLALVMK